MEALRNQVAQIRVVSRFTDSVAHTVDALTGTRSRAGTMNEEQHLDKAAHGSLQFNEHNVVTYLRQVADEELVISFCAKFGIGKDALPLDTPTAEPSGTDLEAHFNNMQKVKLEAYLRQLDTLKEQAKQELEALSAKPDVAQRMSGSMRGLKRAGSLRISTQTRAQMGHDASEQLKEYHKAKQAENLAKYSKDPVTLHKELARARKIADDLIAQCDTLEEINYLIKYMKLPEDVIQRQAQAENLRELHANELKIQKDMALAQKYDPDLVALCTTLEEVTHLIRTGEGPAIIEEDPKKYELMEDKLLDAILFESDVKKDYRIASKKIADNDNCEVLRGTRKKDKMDAAIKVMACEDDDEKEAYRLELRIMATVSEGHEQIIKLQGVYFTQFEMMMAMELCEGGDLFDLIVNQGRLSPNESRAALVSVASALQHVHEFGCIHRDIKPENILLKRAGDPSSAMLSDFDMACPNSASDENKRCIVGTAGYTAPEVLELTPYDYKIDTWSLGVVLYMCLCGDCPFPLDMDKSTKALIIAGDYQFYPEHGWDSMGQAKALVQKMIMVDRNSRASMKQVVEDPWIINT